MSNADFKMRTMEEIAKRERTISTQERQILEMANENKVLEERVKKHEKEIEILMEQQSQEKPMKEPDATKSPGKEYPPAMRYA